LVRISLDAILAPLYAETMIAAKNIPLICLMKTALTAPAVRGMPLLGVLLGLMMLPVVGECRSADFGEPEPGLRVEWVQSWYGWYFPEGNWIRHAEHGLIFPQETPGGSVWAFDLALGHWIYFSQTFFPTVYLSGNQTGWYRYLQGGVPGGRYFYAFDGQAWRHESELLTPREMVFVQGGEFFMQDYWSPGGDPRGEPRWTLLDDFEIGRTEVTLELWTEVRAWAVENGYEVLGSTVGYGCDDDHPVLNVNWYDAVKWCNARSEMEGRQPVYYLGSDHEEVYRTGQHDVRIEDVRWDADGYRLPTEAEWEFAARGGNLTQGFVYSGSDDIERVAWYGFNASGASCGFFGDKGTFPVASKEPNELGIYDMSGNAEEWIWDNPGLYLDAATSHNPKGPANVSSFDRGERGMRGGGFNSTEIGCAVITRGDHSARLRINRFGFRLARSIRVAASGG
jgi:formylglycine-generating enzyme required for sulfatase activity